MEATTRDAFLEDDRELNQEYEVKPIACETEKGN